MNAFFVLDAPCHSVGAPTTINPNLLSDGGLTSLALRQHVTTTLDALGPASNRLCNLFCVLFCVAVTGVKGCYCARFSSWPQQEPLPIKQYRVLEVIEGNC